MGYCIYYHFKKYSARCLNNLYMCVCVCVYCLNNIVLAYSILIRCMCQGDHVSMFSLTTDVNFNHLCAYLKYNKKQFTFES